MNAGISNVFTPHDKARMVLASERTLLESLTTEPVKPTDRKQLKKNRERRHHKSTELCYSFEKPPVIPTRLLGTRVSGRINNPEAREIKRHDQNSGRVLFRIMDN